VLPPARVACARRRVAFSRRRVACSCRRASPLFPREAHAPHRAADVDKIVAMWRGRELEMLRAIHHYHRRPLPLRLRPAPSVIGGGFAADDGDADAAARAAVAAAYAGPARQPLRRFQS